MANIDERKDAHIKICEDEDVQYEHEAGFYDVEFVHNALPEINLKDVDCSTKFLGKRLNAPILITGMTGGTAKAEEINKKLAEAAQDRKVALGLGSCRPILEDETKFETYNVREICPDVPLIANLGAVQIKHYSPEKISTMIEKLGADALNVHLNPLQEAIQPEGETNFAGVLESVKKLCSELKVPVIVKETGAGINATVAIKLIGAGAKYVEVSGKGGTSWSKVEYERGGRLPGFEEWGNSTVSVIAECATVGRCIGTGGVRSGIDSAKAISLGAELAGAAMPFLRAKSVADEIGIWIEQIRTCMFLTGSLNLDELRGAPIMITGKTAEFMRLRGINPVDYAQREAGTVSLPKTSHYL